MQDLLNVCLLNPQICASSVQTVVPAELSFVHTSSIPLQANVNCSTMEGARAMRTGVAPLLQIKCVFFSSRFIKYTRRNNIQKFVPHFPLYSAQNCFLIMTHNKKPSVE